MTADETGPAAQRAKGRGTTSSAKAYERRSRREGAVAGRLTRTGSPVAAAMSRVPFVATIILLLAGGIVGVLWLNTMSDATGLQATASRIRQADIETDIESLRKDVNTLKDPARLAAQAAQAGMVPAGDSALLQVGADGKGTVIGTPTPVAGPPAQAAALPAATSAAATSAAATSAATTTALTTPAATPSATTPAAAPVKTAPATAPAKITPAATTPAKTTAAQSVPATATAPKTTPAARTTPVKTAPAKTTPAKNTPAPRTTPAQQTTTTGAGR